MRLVDVYDAILAAVGLFLEHRFLLCQNLLDYKEILTLVLVEWNAPVLYILSSNPLIFLMFRFR